MKQSVLKGKFENHFFLTRWMRLLTQIETVK